MTTAAAAPADVHCGVADYAEAVVAGDVNVGRLVRLACERHLRDLEEGPARGLRWNQDEADRLLALFMQLEHTKGEWAGRPLALEPWQQFALGCVLGWQRYDADTDRWVRRFNYAYNEVPRKNGKTTTAAGVGNKLAFFDGEQGAEVYFAATKRDQAKIAWSEARRQILRLRTKSKRVRELIQVLTHNVHSPALNSKLEPLGADVDGTDGLNTHAAGIDELHAHKDRGLWDVVEESMAARIQPLLWAITTAGAARTTICWEQHDYSVKVLEQVVDDDTYFAFIATVDEGDEELLDEYFAEPDDNVAEAMLEGVMLVAAKANPNLGVSVRREYLMAKLRKARKTPGLQNSTKRKHFNIWTQGVERWFSTAAWADCEARIDRHDPGELAYRPAFGGLDLGGTTDLNAFLLIIPDGEGGYDVFAWFWMPEDNVAERVEVDHVPYDLWIEQGWITATPGTRRDDEAILADLARIGAVFNIVELAEDPWAAGYIGNKLLEQGVNVVAVPQTFTQLAEASSELESKMETAQIRHDGNPVLAWMISNVVADEHSEGFRKPSKKKSTERIDGVSAFVTGLSRAIKHREDDDEGISMYFPGDEEDE